MPSVYQPRPPEFRLTAGHAALDLVNTVEWRFRPTGPRERLNSYIDLIRFTVWAGVLPERVGAYLLQTVGSKSQKWTLDCVKDMRESVANLVYAGMNPDFPATRDLDSFLRNAVSEVYWIPLSNRATRRHWAWKSGMERGSELPLSLLAGRILNFTNHADPRKVRYCLNPACRKIFLDFSKAGRHWCDMNRCGSAQKRKAFEAKKRVSVVPTIRYAERDPSIDFAPGRANG